MGNKRKAPREIDKCSDASSGYFSAIDQTDFEDVGTAATAAQRMTSASGISPMIIMNNYVLKQPDSETPALKPWKLNPLLDVVPQSQLLFLHPVMPADNCTSQSSEKQKHSRKYVPMQNTLPKNSPHPAHGSTVDTGPSAISKKSTRNGRRHRHHHHHHHDKPLHSLKQDETFKEYAKHLNDASWGDFDHTDADMGAEDSLSRFSDPQEPHTTTSQCPMPQTDSVCSDSVLTEYPQKCSEATVTQSSDVEDISEALSPSSSKQKRFCNTYNILNRSGLLGITLRTKELIRQNKQSQAQLKSLQVHTDLFLEAICSGDPEVWTRLQLTLQNLKDNEITAAESEKKVQPDITTTGCMMRKIV